LGKLITVDREDDAMTAAEKRRHPPGPREPLEAGNPLEIIEGLWREHGPVCRYSAGLGPVYLLADPDGVRRVLSHPEMYPRGEVLGVVLGDGLLASEGEYWKAQRRNYQPKFTPAHLAAYTTAMVEASEATAREWETQARAGGDAVVPVAPEMMRLSLRVVGRTLLGTEIEDADGRISAVVTDVMVHLGRLGSTLPYSFSPEDNRRIRRSFTALDRLTEQLVEQRRARGPGEDLLWLLMQCTDPATGEVLDTKQLRDEVVTVFLGGHETSGVMMAWAWHSLVRHPEVEERLLAEWDAVLGGRPMTFDDVPKLEETARFLDEVLRLYPPVWSLVRKVTEDDEFAGYAIEAGAHVMVSAYLMHRQPEFWPEAERFDPDRFLPARVKDRPRHAYMPFGLGPHLCVGQHFALLEGMAMLTTLGRRFRLNPVEDGPVGMLPLITIRPEGDLRMRVEVRGR
jgi:cytochrome P450